MVDATTTPSLAIPFNPFTIYLLCGPTCSGKSTFSKDLRALYSIYVTELNGNSPLSFTNVVSEVSSDAIRQGLIGASPHLDSSDEFSSRYDDSSAAVSSLAFRLLMLELEALTTFPVNSLAVVVDTTGMNEAFRKEIGRLAYTQGYSTCLILFNYKYQSDYLPADIDKRTPEVKEIVSQSVYRFRTKVLPTIRRSDFDFNISIASKSQFGHISFCQEKEALTSWAQGIFAASRAKFDTAVMPAWANFRRTTLAVPAGKPVAVIGDSHECVEELGQLIFALQYKYPDGVKIVHVGDYLDKGGKTKKMVEFMAERVKAGDLVIAGNHEAFVARRLRGEIESQPDVEKAHFPSLQALNEAGAETIATFLHLWDRALPFVRIVWDKPGSVPAFVTHAPCTNNVIGKTQAFALQRQRNYRIVDREVPMQEELTWLYEEADRSLPLHVFGHVSHLADDYKGIAYKNKVFIDTGAVHGGRLSAAVLVDGKVKAIVSVPSQVRVEAKLPIKLGAYSGGPKEFRLEDYFLDDKEVRLLSQVKKNDVKYISGTMAPSAKLGGKIEPIESALRYFADSGVMDVVLQPKYMGSRAQVYFFKDQPEKTFMVSRGGWKIQRIEGLNQEDFKEFVVGTYKFYEDRLTSFGDVIIDAELMPWHALGRGLIDHSFNSYAWLVEQQLEDLSADEMFCSTELAQGLGLEAKRGHLTEFKKTLAQFTAQDKPWIAPFDILWSSSGNEKGLNFVQKSNILGTPAFQLSLTPEGFASSLAIAEACFFEATVKEGMEGLVVKPLVIKEGVAPYIKVRSEQYLRLVYGYDYLDPVKYDKLVRQKHVLSKLKLSIKEHEMATAMLTATPEARQEIVVKLIGLLREEQSLDPRL